MQKTFPLTSFLLDCVVFIDSEQEGWSGSEQVENAFGF